MATKKAAAKKTGPQKAGKQTPLRDKWGRYEQALGEQALGEEATGQEPAGGAAKEKERPVRCIHRHADVELRRAFPKLCEQLIDKAQKEASVPHTRLLVQIAKLDDKKAAKRRGGPSLSAMLLTELKRRQDERESLMESDAGAADLQSAMAETAAGGATSEDAENQ